MYFNPHFKNSIQTTNRFFVNVLTLVFQQIRTHVWGYLPDVSLRIIHHNFVKIPILINTRSRIVMPNTYICKPAKCSFSPHKILSYTSGVKSLQNDKTSNDKLKNLKLLKTFKKIFKSYSKLTIKFKNRNTAVMSFINFCSVFKVRICVLVSSISV